MNGSHFILWTTEQGGYFKASLGTREQYDDALRTGLLKFPNDWDDESVEAIRFYLIAFGSVEDNYDRGLECSRDDEEGLARYNARLGAPAA